jgi:hypothetical protein
MQKVFYGQIKTPDTEACEPQPTEPGGHRLSWIVSSISSESAGIIWTAFSCSPESKEGHDERHKPIPPRAVDAFGKNHFVYLRG